MSTTELISLAFRLGKSDGILESIAEYDPQPDVLARVAAERERALVVLNDVYPRLSPAEYGTLRSLLTGSA